MLQKNINKILLSFIIVICLTIGVVAFTTPIVTLQSPSSATWLTSGALVNFNFSYSSEVADHSSFCNASLFLNGAKNMTVGNSTGNYENGTTGRMDSASMPNMTVVTMPDGTYIWNIRIENVSGGLFWWAADNYTVNVDSTTPVIGNLSPADSTYALTDALTAKAECNDTNPGTMKLWINGAVNDTLSYTTETEHTFPGVSGFNNGDRVAWTVSCTDDADNEVWATNRTQYMDLNDPVLTSNITNATWFAIGQTIYLNVTLSTNEFPDNCTLWGDFNRSAGVAGTFQANETITNSSGLLNTGVGANFTSLPVVDTNATGMYTWNIICYSKGQRSVWLGANRTLGVDTIAPSAPRVWYLSPQLETNSTASVRRWKNMSTTDVVTDTTPYVRWESVVDVNEVTIRIHFDNDTDGASPIYTFTTTTTNSSLNYTEVSLSPGRPYTTYYYAINVTDSAGNVNSSANLTIFNYTYTYRVSAHGANITASIWNPISVARTGYVNLASIVNETGASYVTIYNKSHVFATCSSAALTSTTCYHNVSQGNPVWIYKSTAGSWDYSWWDITGTLNPIMNSTNIDYEVIGRGLNLTTNVSSATGSRWNYIGILNWSDGCTYQNLEDLMSSETIKVSVTASHNTTNFNMTAQGNITFMSYLNISDSTYYPYYWNFSNPWNETKLDFRGVAAVYLNHSDTAYFNRSGC